MTLGTIPNSQQVATGYNGLTVTAFIENLTPNTDCYWINSRYYFFVGQYDGCNPFLCTRPDFHIHCHKYDFDDIFFSDLTFLQPLMSKDIVVSVECRLPGRFTRRSLNITVKGKTKYFVNI